MAKEHENGKGGPRPAFVWLTVFAALSLVAGSGLVVWGVSQGNPLAGIVGVLLLLDAGIVFMVGWRFR